MDGHEGDVIGQGFVLGPELPDIGIGDRDVDSRSHPVQIGGHLLGRLLTTQQHLVTHHDAADGVGILARQCDGPFDLEVVLVALAADPDAQQHLHAQLLRHLRHVLQPLDDRIGAHAAGPCRQDGKVLPHAGLVHAGIGIHRGFIRLAECGVGQALQLAVSTFGQRLRGAFGTPPGQHPESGHEAEQRHQPGTVAGQELGHE